MISDSPFFTLTIDGWENTRGLEVLNIMVCVPESIFYKSIEIRGEKVDNVLLSRELEKVFEELTINKISALINDNATAIILAQDVLVYKYPHLVGLRCSAHVLNLLIKDICKLNTVYQIFIKAKAIVKEIIGSKFKKGLYGQAWDQYIEEEKKMEEKLPKFCFHCLQLRVGIAFKL